MRLLQLVIDNPWLLFIAVAWLAGMIGNAAKAAKKARERAGQPGAPSRSLRPQSTPATPRQRSAEEVAAEMRRLLGLSPEAKEERKVEVRREPPPPSPRRSVRWDVVEPERSPAPALPSTQDRRLEIHDAPHVGERIQHRHSVQSGRVGQHAPGSSFGTLGGRVHEAQQKRRTATRFPLDDLKRAFVLSEILRPPLALRESGAGGHEGTPAQGRS